jgi:hypothetical protein
MPEYDTHELEETILNKNITFSEFVDILDFFWRDNFDFYVDDIELCIQPVQFNFLYDGSCSIEVNSAENPNNHVSFSRFFSAWKSFARHPRIPRSFIELLQRKYERNFGNIPFENVRHIFRYDDNRGILFVRESLLFFKHYVKFEKLQVMDFHHSKVQNIYRQFRNQSQTLFEEFKQHTMDLGHSIRIVSIPRSRKYRTFFGIEISELIRLNIDISDISEF